MMRGIDVSRAQGTIDWAKVKASGIDFAILEAAIGNDTGAEAEAVAQCFVRNLAGARAVGIPCGAYLFVYAGLPDDPAHPGRNPREQARAHYAACGGLGQNAGDLRPVIDAEWPLCEAPNPKDTWAHNHTTRELIVEWLLEYLDEAEQLWGCVPILYSFPDWIRELGIGNDLRFAKYGLHLASYPTLFQHAYPTDAAVWPTIAPWSSADVWQFSDKMRVPGIVDDVDGDVIRGTDFASFTRGSTENRITLPSPAPTSEPPEAA